MIRADNYNKDIDLVPEKLQIKITWFNKHTDIYQFKSKKQFYFIVNTVKNESELSEKYRQYRID